MVALFNAIKTQQKAMGVDGGFGPAGTDAGAAADAGGKPGSKSVKELPKESFLTLLKKATSGKPSEEDATAAPSGQEAGVGAGKGAGKGKAAAGAAAAPAGKRKWAVLDDDYMGAEDSEDEEQEQELEQESDDEESDD